MKRLFLVLTLLVPFAAHATDRANLPSEERLRLMKNCGALSEETSESSPFGGPKRYHGLRKIIKERRILLYAFDSVRPENGRLDFAKHGKSFGIIYRRETGILD
jgi:hypothetical protein